MSKYLGNLWYPAEEDSRHIIWATAWQNQPNNLCTWRRLRSAWTSAQSDQGLCWRSVGSLGPNISSCGQRRLTSDCADAQADPSLRWPHRSFCWFCHAQSQFYLIFLCCNQSIIPTPHYYTYFVQIDWLEKKFYTSINSMKRNLRTIFLPPALTKLVQ